MLTKLSTLATRLLSLAANAQGKFDPTYSLDRMNWHRDPLSHPEIQAMSERERADLPFNPIRVHPE